MEELFLFDNNNYKDEETSFKNEFDNMNREFSNWQLENLASKIKFKPATSKVKFNIF